MIARIHLVFSFAKIFVSSISQILLAPHVYWFLMRNFLFGIHINQLQIPNPNQPYMAFNIK